MLPGHIKEEQAMDEYQIPENVQKSKMAETRTEQKQQNNFTHPIDFQKDAVKPEEYANKDQRTDEEIARFIEETTAQLEADAQLDEKKRMEVHEKLKKEVDLGTAKKQMVIRDEKWYNFFKKDSPQMVYVKQSLNYLNNRMDQAVPKDANSIIDCKAIEDLLNPAFETVLEACKQYIDSHRGKRHATGRRRLENVMSVQKMVQTEQQRLKVAVNNIREDKLYDQAGVKTVGDLFSRLQVNVAVTSKEEEEGNSTKVDHVKLLADGKHYYAKEDLPLLNEDPVGYMDRRLEQLQRSMANRAKYNPAEYKAKTAEQEKMIKELDQLCRGKARNLVWPNEAAINQLVKDGRMTAKEAKGWFGGREYTRQDADDIIAIMVEKKILAPEQAGQLFETAKFTKELADQLVKNQLMTKERADALLAKDDISDEEADQLIHDIRNTQEEARLRGFLDETDYQAGCDFLTLMKKKITGQAGAEKEAQTRRYLEFLGRDFDQLFKEFNDYNRDIDACRGDKEELENMIKIKEKELGITDGNREEMLKTTTSLSYKTMMADLKSGELKKKTPYEYIHDLVQSGHLGLDAQKDKDILDILKNLQLKDGEKNLGSERIQRLFTRTLGKEAELYGQMKGRGGTEESAVLASNNTATSVFTKHFHREKDSATSSMCLMKNKGDKDYKMYTLSEEAEGEEMMNLVAMSENAGVKLQYSPEVAEQLVCLQASDLFCLQTDRHWRNFKCKVKRHADRWTILSLKSYDHDQSFGMMLLEDYFKEQEESQGKKQRGFVNPYVMTISKKDPRYIYIKRKLIGGEDDQTIKDIQMPEGDKFKNTKQTTARIKGKVTKISKRPLYEWKPDAWTSYFAGLRQTALGSEVTLMKQLNPGKEELVDKFWSAFNKMRSTAEKLNPFVENEKRRTRNDENKKDKKEEGVSITGVLRQLREVKKLYDQLNLTGMEKLANAKLETEREDEPDVKQKNKLRSCLDPEKFCREILQDASSDMATRDGFFDYMVQSTMHCIKTRYATDPDIMEQLEHEDAEDQIKKLKENAQKNPGDPKVAADDALQRKKQLCGVGTGSLRIPTMLHMDAEMFEQIRRVAEGEDKEIEGIMRNLGWDQKKRQILIARAGEIVKQIREAEEIVNAWNDLKGEKDPLKRKFFLQKDDYKKIKKLTDYATDPSLTYFSIEDPNFLAGVPEFAKLMSKSQMEAAIDETNKGRRHVRQRLEPLKAYKQMVDNEIDTGSTQ